MDRLFEIHDEPQGSLLQRAVWWAMFLSEIVITQPQIREKIPDGAELIALPIDDPELLVYNLDLARKTADKPQIFFNVKRNETQVNLLSSMQDMGYAAA